MENSTAQWIMAFGTAFAAFGTLCAAAVAAITAYLSWRSIRRQELRDIPKASVQKRFDNSIGAWTILVSNIGHVAFTVVDAWVSDKLAESRFGLSGHALGSARTVQPGGHATIPFDGRNASGTARIRLADGSEFSDGDPDCQQTKS